MKKINVLFIVMFSIVLVSCGGKSSDKKEVIEDATAVGTDCGCEELVLTTTDKDGNVSDKFKSITKKGSKELYTGSCVEKDQNDSIIRKIDVKNGWLTKELSKEKNGNEYITIKDMSYENTEMKDGWFIKYAEKDEQNNPNLSKFIGEYSEFKNGHKINNWSIQLYGTDYIMVSCKDKPKCMTEAFKTGDIWNLMDLSEDNYIKTLNCLKDELPHFNYWKI